MHIQDCLSPKRIWNKYSEEFVYVPCGKCSACLKSRANKWIERLNVERKSWKYCVFYTLTYAPEHAPYLVDLGHGVYGDISHKHQAPDSPCPLVFEDDIYKDLTPEQVQRERLWLKSYVNIPYLSVYDSQKFIKRLRKNLKNEVKKRYPDAQASDYQVRYYHIGEYGSTTKRAHYHGLLFFSSEKEASCIEECISKSWKLGVTDSSFVAESNAGYLAKYLNCSSDLPKIFQVCKQIRPFAIFSKGTPLGSLYFDEAKVREIFDSASPLVLVDYFKGLSLEYVPLWRLYKDRLFPKLAGFSKFSHFDRTRLYRAGLYFQQTYEIDSSAKFASVMLENWHKWNSNNCFAVDRRFYLDLYDDYLNYIFAGLDDDKKRLNSLIRWYNISARVCLQCSFFNVSLDSYVTQIEKFYDNVSLESLKSQLDFEVNYSEKYGSQSLIGLDKEFLGSLLDVPLELMSAEEVTILESFGVDLQKFTSDDLSERLSYQSLILPENTRDFENLEIDSAAWMRKHTKTKIKNDYLMAHPELKKLVY